jgi:hypothetical protein
MLSFFTMCSDEKSIFQFCKSEWEEAVRCHPELNENGEINFFQRSASVWIEPGKNNYFDNGDIYFS